MGNSGRNRVLFRWHAADSRGTARTRMGDRESEAARGKGARSYLRTRAATSFGTLSSVRHSARRTGRNIVHVQHEVDPVKLFEPELSRGLVLAREAFEQGAASSGKTDVNPAMVHRQSQRRVLAPLIDLKKRGGVFHQFAKARPRPLSDSGDVGWSHSCLPVAIFLRVEECKETD